MNAPMPLNGIYKINAKPYTPIRVLCSGISSKQKLFKHVELGMRLVHSHPKMTPSQSSMGGILCPFR